MSEGQESTFKFDQSIARKIGLILDTPELVRDAKVLSTRSTINIIQILYSRIQGREQPSWWSTGALRQKTMYDMVRLKKILHKLTLIGLVDQVKIKKLISYSVVKKPFHGVIQTESIKADRRRYMAAQYCYRIKADYIDLVFNPHNNRTIFVPAENMHLENLKSLEMLLKLRTMIILKTLGDIGDPMDTNQIQDYLNKYFSRNTKLKQVEYNLSSIRTLTKHPFVDNIGAKISSNHKKYKDTWTVLNRDTIHKKGRNYNMLYSLNFDRIRIYFTDKIGQELTNNNNSFEIIYPNPPDIQLTDKEIKDDIETLGVIVDIN
ncbi:MAG: hypothetical protein HeimC2_21550 [Candidatus Heimdallarchaeota archaeon LC_2]|nr:MAG: hypothetical protein HeimC2_21550 [Candidatus Heimdallarchaeota archaeon LC_2]